MYKNANVPDVSIRKAVKVAALAGVSLLALGAVWGTAFTIDTTEVGYVRRFGGVEEANLIRGDGRIHFKLPFIDTLDTIRITIDTKAMKGIVVQTNDNQPIQVSTSITYRIPASAAYHLLYKVGKSGNFDVDSNVDPVIRDRIMKIFAQKNTVKISEERTAISAEIQAAVTKSLGELYKIEVLDFQISEIKYSEQFARSVDEAVKAKNDAITSENRVRAARFDGEKKVIEAQAQRDSEIARAEGEAKAIKLRTEAEAEGITAKSKALEKNTALVGLVMAEKWNGVIPVTIGNTGGTIMDLRGVLPALTGESKRQ
jgi:regulator of protease activity HflC (stomatin/prohibitin superfamily)